jgi:hypothetical protein
MAVDVREKLWRFVKEAIHSWESDVNMSDHITDNLIAHAVTVQEWISVKEGLPDESGLYITFGCTAVPVRWLHNFDKNVGKFGAWWDYEPDGKEHPRYRFIEAGNITHWMPLPEPPKGE